VAGSPQAGPGRPVALVRGLHTAIVDEADSILIDEAVTPLILAAPHERRGLDDAVRRISALADSLAEGRDFLVEAREQQVLLLPEARQRLTDIAPMSGGLAPGARREELLGRRWWSGDSSNRDSAAWSRTTRSCCSTSSPAV
jgi:preprotein translocase subunit SecA